MTLNLYLLLSKQKKIELSAFEGGGGGAETSRSCPFALLLRELPDETFAIFYRSKGVKDLLVLGKRDAMFRYLYVTLQLTSRC